MSEIKNDSTLTNMSSRCQKGAKEGKVFGDTVSALFCPVFRENIYGISVFKMLLPGDRVICLKMLRYLGILPLKLLNGFHRKTSLKHCVLANKRLSYC